MRNLLRVAVAGLVAGCLASGLALASPELPLGSIVLADRAYLGSNLASAGATVFAGDQLSTDEGGALRVRLGNGQLYLPAKSVAALEAPAGSIAAKLLRGTVGFSSSGESAIVVRASEVLIRPKTVEPTHGQVQLVGPREMIISSYRGSLEVLVGSETYLVAPNTGYRLLLDSPQGAQGTTAAGGGGHAVLWTVLTVAVIGAIAGAWVLVSERSNISVSRP